ncbi:sulfite exporter TauE/SafE family protein [Klebsiella sp. RHBSTW-00215]|uniref:sulfite exporter TauE/SafE family protein n=1 Tax=Klebsiella sp. RHBSTW-00215 TaxID=2742640 RepID=UPI0015F69C96|nr:sulfite exporter TauE/SafE family protein [Klebsiella sp. RHBSTW-00215]MBA7933268.1 sulfite exporter TauE/SafE family protein [Klebsiella sp. RHBSTW-00215]
MSFNTDFILVGLMQIVGFFVQGCTGFGCTVIAASVTNGLLGTSVGVPYGTLITLPFLYFLAVRTWRDVSWKDLGKIVALCVPGILVGNYLFYRISPNVAKICIGAMVTIIAVMNIYKHIVNPLFFKKAEAINVPDTTAKKCFRYGCLILGGVVHGAFTIGGPLITVYTIEAVKEKEKFRNTMNMVWVVFNTWNAFNQYRNGAWTEHLGGALTIGFPMAAIGFFLGMAFLQRINKETFLRIVYCVLLFVGGNMLFTSLMALA